MSLFATLQEKRAERKAALDAAGVILTNVTGEKRAMNTEETSEFERRHAAGEALKVEITRIERQLDAERELADKPNDERRGGREDTGGDDNDDPKVKEKRAKNENRVFDKILRHGIGELTPEEQKEVRTRNSEARSLSAIIGSAGAFTVPQGFIAQMDVAVKWFGGMLQAATIMPTGSGEQLPWPTSNDTNNTGRRIGENTAANTSGKDPTFGAMNLNAYMYTSDIVLLPIQLVQDSAIDIQPILSEMLGMRIGRIVNTETTTGTAASMPNGIVNASTLGFTAAANNAIAYSDLIQLEHSVDPAYRTYPGTGYMFHDNILKAVKLLVDSNGRPLFVAGGVSEGIQNKSPDTINGYPYTINQDMASSMASGNKIALFGALKKYIIRKVGEVAMVRLTERYAELMQVGFMAYQRYDGNLLDAGTHPVKYLQN